MGASRVSADCSCLHGADDESQAESVEGEHEQQQQLRPARRAHERLPHEQVQRRAHHRVAQTERESVAKTQIRNSEHLSARVHISDAKRRAVGGAAGCASVVSLTRVVVR